MQEVIINKINKDISIYVLEDNKLCEMYTQSPDRESTLGNIYIGNVEDIVDGMQAAFINIGLEKKAFISLKDAMKKVDITKDAIDTNIKMSEILKHNQKILVQVKKEPSGEKGARVSTHVTLPGNYVVLMPDTDIITVSQKIEEEKEVARLKEILKSNLPKTFGAIVRTDAENIDDEIIKADIKNLLELWEDLLKKKANCSDVEIIYSDYDMVLKTLRDIVNKNTSTIYVNDKEIFNIVTEKASKVECKFYENTDLISKLGLETEVSKAHERKIWLKHGGQIVIDKTEALTAIDVNSSKYTGFKDLETTTLSVNLEAAAEIMKQIRLKDIGGIIVIDYIDMKEKEHQEQIIEIMKKEAKKDRSKVDIREFTELNLVELTRKKMFI